MKKVVILLIAFVIIFGVPTLLSFNQHYEQRTSTLPESVLKLISPIKTEFGPSCPVCMDVGQRSLKLNPIGILVSLIIFSLFWMFLNRSTKTLN